MTPERKRLIAETVAQLRAKHAKATNAFDNLVNNMQSIVDSTFNEIKPILKAGGGNTEQKQASLKELVFKSNLDKLRYLSKDELAVFCCITISEAVMAEVESRPWGDDQRDILSE